MAESRSLRRVLGSGRWRLGEQAGAGLPGKKEGGLLFPPPHKTSATSPLSSVPMHISLQMALGVTAFDGGAAGARGQSPVPRSQGELTRLL